MLQWRKWRIWPNYITSDGANMSGEFDNFGDFCANYVMGYLSGAGDFEEFWSNLPKQIDDFYANCITRDGDFYANNVTRDGPDMLANLASLTIFMQIVSPEMAIFMQIMSPEMALTC